MPILVPSDTRKALRPNAEGCDSRSLFLDRFVDPLAEKDDRRNTFTRAFAAKAATTKAKAWLSFLSTLVMPRESHSPDPTPDSTPRPDSRTPPRDNLLFAQVQARFMVNMAGGVMENAGLCIDRFGLPYIPGSAVKGCARRAALATLQEWCETGQKPGSPGTGDGHPLADICPSFAEPRDLFVAIARAFGWCEADWKDASDFAWACGPHWNDLRIQAQEALGCGPRKDFAGTVSFLPAYPTAPGTLGPAEGLPLRLPSLGELELDVVTCHHREYYGEPKEPKGIPHADPKWKRWKAEHDRWERDWATAPDIEEPNPVVFPSVAPGHVFVFALLPLRPSSEPDVIHARTWLATGLSVFGLGAKTNAGYGWFRDVTEAVRTAFEADERRRIDEERQREEVRKRAAARAMLQPDQPFLEKLRAMKEADLRGQINAFAAEERFWTQSDESHQFTILHFLDIESPKVFESDRANPKSKISKALAQLRRKFTPQVSPEGPSAS